MPHFTYDHGELEITASTLHGVSWETYKSLLADHADSSAPHFNYDHGELEIMSPFMDHEEYK